MVVSPWQHIIPYEGSRPCCQGGTQTFTLTKAMSGFVVSWFATEWTNGKRRKVVETRAFSTGDEAEAEYTTRIYTGDTEGLCIRHYPDGQYGKLVREYQPDGNKFDRSEIDKLRKKLNNDVAAYNDRGSYVDEA